MNKRLLSISAEIAALIALVALSAGCVRKASPDVTPTPGGWVQIAETPDWAATAQANSMIATQTAQAMLPLETDTPTPEPTPEPPTPTPTPTPFEPLMATPAPTPASSAGIVTYVVQRGDNLFRIAMRYGTTVEAIASANGIANPALIYVGQTLLIPASGTRSTPQAGEEQYVVRPGDNLFRIAMRYNLNYMYLAQYNGIANPSYIYVGQVLRIPPR